MEATTRPARNTQALIGGRFADLSFMIRPQSLLRPFRREALGPALSEKVSYRTERLPFALITFCVVWLAASRSFPAEQVIPSTQTGEMVTKEGDVNYHATGRPEKPADQPQALGFGDALRTLQLSRATVRLLDLEDLRLKELTRLEIQRSSTTAGTPKLRLHEGQIYLSERRRLPRVIPVETRYSQVFPRGTEYIVAVDPAAQQTIVTMFDGEAEVQGTNDPAPVRVSSGYQGITAPGQPTQVRPILQAQNIVQWWIYYPGLLDPDELALTAAEQAQLAASLQAYRLGDLQEALKQYPRYPTPVEPSTDAQRAYLAGLFLAVGAVDRSEAQLSKAEPNAPTTRALQTMIGAVTVDFQKVFATNAMPAAQGEAYSPSTASEWLALSYAHQATNNLKAALAAARKAVGLSPGFGFGWERVGELEFSFGRTSAAREAAQQAINFSPRNAQAHALNGFLLAAERKDEDALDSFEKGIAIDPSLGNAWLGRGLCKIRRSTAWFQGAAFNPAARVPASALKDLQTAAILEPTRSLVRSYAGKAFADIGNARLGRKELDYATRLDPNDPTPLLYSALLEQQENRINEAVADLEGSQARNDNRSLFRSRLLLDEDRAVRSVNLASIYRDAGMFDVSVREASRAVTADYANYSAHLFLANSYNELRDPALINLRYETATFSEYLVANLMSPVGGSALSPYVSQQEYSPLFEQHRFGLSSETTYSSRGDWQQQASQFGWVGDTAYAVDVFYHTSNGERPNNDLEQQAYSAQVKQQLSPQDSLYLQAVFNYVESGDLRQVYDPHDPTQFSPNLRVTEKQEPNLFIGYHHEWSPGVHTLFLGSRLSDRFRLSDKYLVIPDVIRDSSGNIVDTAQRICGSDLCDIWNASAQQSEFEAYSAELQQILEVFKHTLIAGVRYQDGTTDSTATETRARGSFIVPAGPNDFVSVQHNKTDLERFSCYAYDQWHALDCLWLIGGVSFDKLHFPINADSVPISSEERNTERLSPKAGFIWTPGPATTFRGAYTRSVGGLFYDSSVRLEPVQIAGFNQAYRSLIPESLVGNVPGSRFETFDLGLEQKLNSGTFFVLQAELLRSHGSHDLGAFDFSVFGTNDPAPSQIPQNLAYEERSFIASVNQLVGREWSLGARYKLSEAELDKQYPGVSATLIPPTSNRAVLHELNLFAIYNHPSGFFAEPQVLWRMQSNYDYQPARPGDDFWQVNFFVGYRFPRRQAQATLGFLNLTDQDYRLNPLSPYNDLPRGRTLLVSFKFNL